MKKLSEKQIIEEMHRAYMRRLHEVMGETDVRDTRGNVVIQPGLKVRHKKSQYEYTVASVEDDPETDEIMIILRNPESPRFEPTSGETFVGEETPILSSAPSSDHDVTGHDMELMRMTSDKDDLDSSSDSETIFVVDEKEFEKDYEVK